MYLLNNFVSRRGFLKLSTAAGIQETKALPAKLANDQLAKVKSTTKNLKTINSNLKELGEKGNNITSRRNILKGFKNKVLIEAGKRPKNTNTVLGKVGSGITSAVGNVNGMNVAEKLNRVKLGKLGKLASKITSVL